MRNPEIREDAAPRTKAEAVIRDCADRKKYKRNTAGFIIKIIVVFSFALLVLFRYASITEVGQRINKTKKEYEELTAKNKILVSELSKYEDVEMLKTIATERFGLVPPTDSQKVFIETEVRDHTEVYNLNLTEEKKEAPEKTFKEKLRTFLGLL